MRSYEHNYALCLEIQACKRVFRCIIKIRGKKFGQVAEKVYFRTKISS